MATKILCIVSADQHTMLLHVFIIGIHFEDGIFAVLEIGGRLKHVEWL